MKKIITHTILVLTAIMLLFLLELLNRFSVSRFNYDFKTLIIIWVIVFNYKKIYNYLFNNED